MKIIFYIYKIFKYELKFYKLKFTRKFLVIKNKQTKKNSIILK